MYPGIRSMILIGCGHADSLTKSWAQDNLIGDISAISINELSNRGYQIRRWLRKHGYDAYRVSFEEANHAGELQVGVRLATYFAEAGLGYIGTIIC